MLERLEKFARMRWMLGPARRAFKRGDAKALKEALLDLRQADIDEYFLNKSDPFLSLLRGDRKLVATFDTKRRPKDDEIVVILGNYPHDFRNVVVHNPMKRNLLDFWRFSFDLVESDPCWDAVGAIYVINLDSRPDRYYSLLRELGRVGAPLDRLVRIPGVLGPSEYGRPMNVDVGCLKSHILTIETAIESGHEHILVLEDDFTFTDELEENKAKIAEFFARGYRYKVCLLGTSKYGRIADYDDLVSASFQECTNTEGYFASRQGLVELRDVFAEGLSMMLKTRDQKYAVDRHWAKMQDGETFLVFREKLGLQAPNYSDMEGRVTAYLD